MLRAIFPRVMRSVVDISLSNFSITFFESPWVQGFLLSVPINKQLHKKPSCLISCMDLAEYAALLLIFSNDIV